MYDLDETDRRILARLGRDGRASLESIAQEIGLRRPSVHERLRKLEAAKVVRGYHAALDPEAVEAGLVAFVLLKVAPCAGEKDCMTRCEEIAQRLRRLPQVLEFHTVAGSEDALVKVRVKDIRELERVVMREVSGTPGVDAVTTKVVLSTHFERPIHVETKPSPTRARRGREPG